MRHASLPGWLLIAALALLLLLPAAGRAQSGMLCDVCGTRLTGPTFETVSRDEEARRIVVCEACTHIPTRCFLCGLPVHHGFRELGDGRVLCEHDIPRGVLDPATAMEVFLSLKPELFSMFRDLGVLPDRNITLRLVDQRELQSVFSNTPGVHPDVSLQGLTRSRPAGRGVWEHEIFLCSGLTRQRLAAVAPHEFTHAWVRENTPRDRKLDADTEEGFCELAAFQLMTERGQEWERRQILANTYTRGKIGVLVKVSDDYQFHRVAAWIKGGVDATLESDRPDRLIAMKTAKVPSGFLVEARTRVPDTLVLKGLSGSGAHRFALINDATLAAGEQARVRVGDSNVVVRCEEIRQASAVVRVAGSPGSLELQLTPRPASP